LVLETLVPEIKSVSLITQDWSLQKPDTAEPIAGWLCTRDSLADYRSTTLKACFFQKEVEAMFLLRSVSELFPRWKERQRSRQLPAPVSRRRQWLMIEPLEERYLLDGTWTTGAPMPLARWHSGYGVVNDILYIAGGFFNPPGTHTTDVQAYNAAANTWSLKSPRPNVQTAPASGVINGILYTAGGTNTAVQINTLMAYNPVPDSWTPKASMPTARSHAGGGVVNSVMYVVGGFFNASLNTVEAYDPASNAWTTKAPMPTARGVLGLGVVNGTLYAVGGFTFDNVPLNTVEAYNPVSNTWTAKAPMPTARGHLGVAVLNGILYAVGGHDGTRVLDTVEAYHPCTDSWTTEPSLPTARAGLEVAAVNDHLYAVGGWTGVNTAVTTNEFFTPITLTATGTSLSATVGQRFAAVVGSFGDSSCNPGAVTDYSAIIDWGDHSRPSTGGISDNGGGTFDVAASHTYAAPGPYTITITITDNRDPTRNATAYSDAEVTDGGSAPSRHNKPSWEQASRNGIAALDWVLASQSNRDKNESEASSMVWLERLNHGVVDVLAENLVG
jgi:hypothetical protein